MDRYMHGVPCWVDTTQPAPAAAQAFYTKLFGWTYETHDGSGYAMAKLRDGYAGAITAADQEAPATWNTYVWVDDVDEVAQRAAKAGGTVLVSPYDLGQDGRSATIADPAGARLQLWQPGDHRGADRINEPGSWNFNDLQTTDVEGAKAFYGEVFGWHADEIDFGFGKSWMWKLDGYGDLLANFDPNIRERQAADQAPDGFWDVVAWMSEVTDETPPTWGITFSVENTDAALDRATKGGAEVIVPAYDAGPVRTAVIKDPQGAVLTLSKYTSPTT
ncbi:VOC family protein [Tenggerimyces flavus]|uniref:VOC family protein n=1 Tax=Tenggerimyces flavus TaxID=1708749 RepID=A0ABV7YE33_9ACTN|nr:VOC family protein [Tenggerimyces flavus]MBM7786045.1 putative enzyme related to lactoylglutathione lyase [Tenggerimyces flavus]